MCTGSEAGSYLRLIYFVHHSTPGLKVIKKKKKIEESLPSEEGKIQRISMTFNSKAGPNSGPDCLICTEFTRQWPRENPEGYME